MTVEERAVELLAKLTRIVEQGFDIGPGDLPVIEQSIRAAVEEAVKVERERIAQEAEKKAKRFFECALANSHVTFAPGECSAVNAVLVTFAAAIRGAK